MNNPQSIHVRLSPVHMARLHELVKHHGLRASELIRRLIDVEHERARREERQSIGIAYVGQAFHD